jgi:hypothetical protein
MNRKLKLKVKCVCTSGTYNMSSDSEASIRHFFPFFPFFQIEIYVFLLRAAEGTRENMEGSMELKEVQRTACQEP